MSERINFKLAFGGETYRFASTLVDNDLYDAVRAKVVSVTGDERVEMYWIDDDSHVVLSCSEDLQTAIEYARFTRKNPAKPPCVRLVVQSDSSIQSVSDSVARILTATAAEVAKAEAMFAASRQANDEQQQMQHEATAVKQKPSSDDDIDDMLAEHFSVKIQKQQEETLEADGVEKTAPEDEDDFDDDSAASEGSLNEDGPDAFGAVSGVLKAGMNLMDQMVSQMKSKLPEVKAGDLNGLVDAIPGMFNVMNEMLQQNAGDFGELATIFKGMPKGDDMAGKTDAEREAIGLENAAKMEAKMRELSEKLKKTSPAAPEDSGASPKPGILGGLFSKLTEVIDELNKPEVIKERSEKIKCLQKEFDPKRDAAGNLTESDEKEYQRRLCEIWGIPACLSKACARPETSEHGEAPNWKLGGPFAALDSWFEKEMFSPEAVERVNKAREDWKKMEEQRAAEGKPPIMEEIVSKISEGIANIENDNEKKKAKKGTKLSTSKKSQRKRKSSRMFERIVRNPSAIVRHMDEILFHVNEVLAKADEEKSEAQQPAAEPAAPSETTAARAAPTADGAVPTSDSRYPASTGNLALSMEDTRRVAKLVVEIDALEGMRNPTVDERRRVEGLKAERAHIFFEALRQKQQQQSPEQSNAEKVQNALNRLQDIAQGTTAPAAEAAASAANAEAERLKQMLDAASAWKDKEHDGGFSRLPYSDEEDEEESEEDEDAELVQVKEALEESASDGDGEVVEVSTHAPAAAATSAESHDARIARLLDSYFGDAQQDKDRLLKKTLDSYFIPSSTAPVELESEDRKIAKVLDQVYATSNYAPTSDREIAQALEQVFSRLESTFTPDDMTQMEDELHEYARAFLRKDPGLTCLPYSDEDAEEESENDEDEELVIVETVIEEPATEEEKLLEVSANEASFEDVVVENEEAVSDEGSWTVEGAPVTATADEKREIAAMTMKKLMKDTIYLSTQDVQDRLDNIASKGVEAWLRQEQQLQQPDVQREIDEMVRRTLQLPLAQWSQQYQIKEVKEIVDKALAMAQNKLEASWSIEEAPAVTSVAAAAATEQLQPTALQQLESREAALAEKETAFERRVASFAVEIEEFEERIRLLEKRVGRVEKGKDGEMEKRMDEVEERLNKIEM